MVGGHRIRVERTFFDWNLGIAAWRSYWGYQASCSCGWTGPCARDYDFAVKAAERHVGYELEQRGSWTA